MVTNVFDSIKETLYRESEAILEIRNSLDQGQVNKVYEAIRDCKGKIMTTGCGTSAMLARKVAHTLCCVSCPATFIVPSDAVHGALGLIEKDDIVIVFSKGGETAEINNMIPSIKKREATLICVSESKDAYISRQSDIFLKVKIDAEADDLNILATSSTLVTIAIFDAISIAITRFRGFNKEQFAVIHPGGKVGKKLTGCN